MFWIALVAQITGTGGIGYGPSLPATCTPGDVFAATTNPSLSICTATNTWATLPTSAGGVPSGTIAMITSGTCGTGWAEVSGLDGKTLFGTVAAHGDIGQAVGNDSITPTIASLTAAAQTFTGSSANTSDVSGGTPAGTNSTGTVTPLGTIAWPGGVPTNAWAIGTLAVTSHTSVSTKQGSSAGNVVTTATHTFTGSPTITASWPAGVPTLSGSSSVTSAEVFTGTSLDVHHHALTATGTNGTSAVTGTLNNFDNRSAGIKVIFCVKQ